MAKLLLEAEYPGIVGFPPPQNYVIWRDSIDRLWVSTALPIYVYYAERGVAMTNPYGEDRDVVATGDRGEFYTFIERVPGEVWGAAYGAKNRVTRFTPTRLSYSYPGINRLWRPKGVATDGTVIWWMGNNGDLPPHPLGTILRTDAAGAGTVFTDVVPQILVCADYFGGVLYACGSGEGISGADPDPWFYAINPTTMTVIWQARLAGTRPLSMYRISATEYVVICHLSTDTSARLVLIDIAAEERAWTVEVPGVRIYGRARNTIVDWMGDLWTIADDGLYTIDVPGQTMVKQVDMDPSVTLAGNVVASTRFGLVLVDPASGKIYHHE